MYWQANGDVSATGQGTDSNAIVTEKLANEKGGIDLASDKMTLNEEGDKVDFAAVDPAMLEQGIDGLVPVVFFITPLTDPAAFFAASRQVFALIL